MNQKIHEISIWDNVFTYVIVNKNTEQFIEELVSIDDLNEEYWLDKKIKTTYMKERKIAVIGSDAMSNIPIAAYEKDFYQNMNGSYQLTFKMNYKYFDEEQQALIENPFIKYLVNERKIKLKYDNQWYDFLIKEVEEDSEAKVFTYTANALFINELSKRGNSIELNVELENNIGTVDELANYILKDTGWIVEKGDILHSYNEEALYEVLLAEDTILEEFDFSQLSGFGRSITLPKNSKIYVFYSSLTNELDDFQVLYSDKDYEFDDNLVCTNAKNYRIKDVEVVARENGFTVNIGLYCNYTTLRGKRIVRKQKTEFLPKLKEIVKVYNDNGLEVLGLEQAEYITSETVKNIIQNGSDFIDKTGWEDNSIKILPIDSEVPSNGSLKSKVTVLDGDQMPETEEKTTHSCLEITKLTDDYGVILNSSLNWSDSIKAMEDTFVEGNELVIGLRGGIINSNGDIVDISNQENFDDFTDKKIGLQLGLYKEEILNDETVIYKINKVLLNYETQDQKYAWNKDNVISKIYDKEGKRIDLNRKFNRYAFYPRVRETFDKKYMQDNGLKLGLFVICNGPKDSKFYLEELMLFKKIAKDESIIDLPGIILPTTDSSIIQPDSAIMGTIKTKYTYFLREENKDVEDVLDIIPYAPTAYEPKNYVKVYDQNCEKIRTLEAADSNCFNLIQDLCEIFECWAKFEVEHEENGALKLQDYKPIKKVSFHEYIAENNYAGFRYGINLGSIQRTIQSEQIVSKMLVKINNNEFGKDGFCSIARAQENPTKENFVFDFSYFTNQLLLDNNVLQRDLYFSDENVGSLGYYHKLYSYNKTRDQLIQEQNGLSQDLDYKEADVVILTAEIDAITEELQEQKDYLEELTSFSIDELIEHFQDNDLIIWDKFEEAKNRTQEYINYTSKRIKTINDLKIAKALLTEATKEYNNKTENLKKISDSIKQLNLDFETKYSEYIQEGIWMSEDYFDDNLYYLDSLSTLHTSSQPQITYSIKVMELSQIPGYENYNFSIGQKTYIEDTDYFGWIIKNGVKTPRREEVIISEIHWKIDAPWDNEITVQNYKTQFEDLFQRMAAATTSIEYSTGKYEKISSIADSSGNIRATALEAALINNSFVLSTAKDESVIIDDTGITTSSLRDPSKKVRIISGGIFLSTDGGENWTTGINATGISANILTAGRVNTSNIMIGNDGVPSFRWDSNGISAYSLDNTGSYLFDKYVRFDRYGIYGINGDENFKATSEDDVIEKAKFSLTWSGFHLKTTEEDQGGIEITSERDFVVKDDNGNAKVQIGRINENKKEYGLAIYGKNGLALEAKNGILSLSDRLNISSSNYKIGIGFLGKTDGEDKNRIFEAGSEEKSKFIIWEDGSIKALDGTFSGKLEAATGSFTGSITATSGTIGGVTISGFGYRTEIESSKGSFIDPDAADQITILTARVYINNDSEDHSSDFNINWYKADTEELLGSEQTLEVDMNQIESYSIYFIATKK